MRVRHTAKQNITTEPRWNDTTTTTTVVGRTWKNAACSTILQSECRMYDVRVKTFVNMIYLFIATNREERGSRVETSMSLYPVMLTFRARYDLVLRVSIAQTKNRHYTEKQCMAQIYE